MGERQNQPFQLTFNASLKVAFHGSRVTSNGGLILVRELDERLGFGELIKQHLGARGESVSEGEILEEWACEEEGEVRQWRHGDGHTKTTGTTGRFVDRDGRSAAVWGAFIL